MARPFNAPDVYRAVAHPVRRRVLELLQTRERSPAELWAEFNIAMPTLSQHLKVLRMAELVTTTDRGKYRFYRLAAKRLADIHTWSGRFAR